jgi:segregation and condensation protein A
MIVIQQERNSSLPPNEADLDPAGDAASTISSGPNTRLTSFDEINIDSAIRQVSGLGNDPGLGLLVDLAKKGEYDPWNVDIVSLTDSYLNALDDTLDAQDLGRVARMIFYAAALIHLKAKALAARQRSLDYEEALEQALADEFDDGTFGGPESRLRPGDMPLDYGFMADLEKGGPIGLAPQDRPVRQRGLSLVDLIVALREYDERLAQREAAFEDEPEFTDEMVYEECLGGSHQEDLGTDIVDVRTKLWATLPDSESVTLASLCTEHLTRGSVLLALLFLSNDEEVYLEQDEFFTEVRIVKGPYFGEIVAGVVSDDEEDEEEFEGDDR